MIGGEIYDRQRGIHAHPIINRDFVTGASCGLRSMELAAECSRSFFSHSKGAEVILSRGIPIIRAASFHLYLCYYSVLRAWHNTPDNWTPIVATKKGQKIRQRMMKQRAPHVPSVTVNCKIKMTTKGENYKIL